MSKKWKFIGSNTPMPMSEEERRKYDRRMFKWGLKLQKMQPDKPKINFKSGKELEISEYDD